MGCRRKAAWNCSGFVIGYLREEPKARKGRALGDFVKSKCWKQRGKGIKGSICVEAGASNRFVWRCPVPDNHSLSHLLISQ